MHILTAQVIYLLQRGDVEVVIDVFDLTGLQRGGFLGERTGHGSRLRIGNPVVPLLCKEEAGVVGCPPKETGQRRPRRWGRTRRERVRLVPVGRPRHAGTRR